MTFRFLVVYRFEISGFVPNQLGFPREEQHRPPFIQERIVKGGCRGPSSTARGAASLYVVGTYLRKEVKPPFGRFYEIKKRASARASTASALFYYLYIRFAAVTSLLDAFLVITHTQGFSPDTKQFCIGAIDLFRFSYPV